LTVTNPAGEPVAGSLELRGEDDQYWVVWTPDAPLTPGTEYAFEFAAEELSEWGPITLSAVAAERSGTPPEPAAMLLTAARDVGTRVCCPADSNACQSDTCFSDRQLIVPALSLRVSEEFGAWPVEARITWISGAAVSTTDWHLLHEYARHEFEATEDRYCYRLELRDLRNGEVSSFPERCFDRGELELGERAVSGTGLRDVLSDCAAPPAGYETEWCATQSPCEAGEDSARCETIAQFCKDVGSPSEEAGSPSEDTPSGEASDDGAADPQGGSGCSTAPGRSAGAPLLGVGLGLAWAMARRRQRARLAHRGTNLRRHP
jgi:hypothetical protein